MIGVAIPGSDWYPQGAQSNRKNVDLTPFRRDCEIDMLLNMDEKTLRWCVVGKNEEKHIIKFTNIPLQSNGYVPHFNVYYTNLEMRLAQIPPSLFGKAKDIFK